MKRKLVFGLLAASLFSFGVFAQKADRARSADLNRKAKAAVFNVLRPVNKVVRPVGSWFAGLFGGRDKIPFCPPHPWIEKVTLNRSEISLSCVNYYSPCNDKSALIEIFAEGGSYRNEPFAYGYQVSAGRIIGAGAKVAWDLSGVKPGTYTVTAFALNTEYGLSGMTKTETVTVLE